MDESSDKGGARKPAHSVDSAANGREGAFGIAAGDQNHSAPARTSPGRRAVEPIVQGSITNQLVKQDQLALPIDAQAVPKAARLQALASGKSAEHQTLACNQGRSIREMHV